MIRALEGNDLSDLQAKQWGDLVWILQNQDGYVDALLESTHTTVLEAVNDAYQERFGTDTVGSSQKLT